MFYSVLFHLCILFFKAFYASLLASAMKVQCILIIINVYPESIFLLYYIIITVQMPVTVHPEHRYQK